LLAHLGIVHGQIPRGFGNAEELRRDEQVSDVEQPSVATFPDGRFRPDARDSDAVAKARQFLSRQVLEINQRQPPIAEDDGKSGAGRIDQQHGIARPHRGTDAERTGGRFLGDLDKAEFGRKPRHKRRGERPRRDHVASEEHVHKRLLDNREACVR